MTQEPHSISKHPTGHKPVLLAEVLQYLAPQSGEVYVDATFGAGGYTKAILSTNNTKVIALDRDNAVLQYVNSLKTEYTNRLSFENIDFASIKHAVQKHSQQVDGIVYDIGVSSMQLDVKERGFSFTGDQPLDMRMDTTQSLTAAEIINSYPQEQLANLIYAHGGERKSRIIAKKILQQRQVSPITTTKQLRDIIISAVGRYNDKIDPATRTFQALRIEVNDELQQLKHSLNDAISLLKEGGRLVVVTFHSGEDKIVKDIFKQLTTESTNNTWPLIAIESNAKKTATFKKLHSKVITPQTDEILANPRARSAKLRAIQKIAGGTL